MARSLCSPAITSSTAEAGGHGRGLPTRTLPGPCSGCLPRPSRLALIRGWPCAGGLSLSLQWKQRQDLQCRHLMEIAPTKEAGKPAHPFAQKLGYIADQRCCPIRTGDRSHHRSSHCPLHSPSLASGLAGRSHPNPQLRPHCAKRCQRDFLEDKAAGRLLSPPNSGT